MSHTRQVLLLVLLLETLCKTKSDLRNLTLCHFMRECMIDKAYHCGTRLFLLHFVRAYGNYGLFNLQLRCLVLCQFNQHSFYLSFKGKGSSDA